MPLHYFDNNATTQPAPEVVEAMQPSYATRWGNPSSLHQFGREVATDLDAARQAVATLIGAPRASSVIFTSSGTEADNLALFGLCAAQPTKRHLVTSTVEHAAVRNYCALLEEQGYTITRLPVAADGTLDPQQVADVCTPETACVSLMWANNETGVLFPIEQIAAICEERGVPFHCDAVQAIGKVSIDLCRHPIAALSLSGHKFHAPKGVGALYLRPGTPFRPMFRGGGQEQGRRAGTENVAQIVGLGVAATLARTHLSTVDTAVRALRDRMEHALLTRIPDMAINGHRTLRVANTTSVRMEGVDGEGMILALSEGGIAASTGSACAAGSIEPSHVLRAMGFSNAEIRGTLRLSISRYTTNSDIDALLEQLPAIVATRRRLAPPRRS
ncbi:MAG: aminotransferase class V-fold PLP-dependent enzyme [Deltaproteobacteria bacterium]|nr:aminotransferase class V-fold PLP-dependent enzyme [Deltaproteobacteria bacterium]